MRNLQNLTLLLAVVISFLIVGCEEDQLTNAEIANGDDEQATVLSESTSEIDGVEGMYASKGNPKKPKDKCKKKDEPCDVSIQTYSELFIRVEDSEGELVSGFTLCAWDSASNNECGASLSSVREGTNANWSAELGGGGGELPPQVELDTDTKYIISTSDSENKLYFHFETGEGDPRAKFVRASPTTSEGTFSVSDAKQADLAIVKAVPNNISVGTPRWVDNILEITWDADWQGEPSYGFPSFMLSTADVKIKNGGTLQSAVSQSSGTGSYNWTPSQTYSNIKIVVEDRISEESGESSSFNVDYGPLDEVNIQGPTSREAGQSGTWIASFINGTPSFSYDWDYLFICNERSANPTPQVETCDTWYQGGTSSSYIKTVSGAEFDMRLALTVTDSASPPASDTVYLIVDIYDP